MAALFDCLTDNISLFASKYKLYLLTEDLLNNRQISAITDRRNGILVAMYRISFKMFFAKLFAGVIKMFYLMCRHTLLSLHSILQGFVFSFSSQKMSCNPD
jgi:hypothetical protein